MYWPVINSVVVLFILVAFFVVVRQIFKCLHEQKNKLQTQESKLADAVEKLKTFENITTRQQVQLLDLNKKLAAYFSPLEIMEQNLDALNSKVQLLESNIDSESTEQKLYGRAKKMIQMGADIDELMIECEIPRAEAELLLSIYKL